MEERKSEGKKPARQSFGGQKHSGSKPPHKFGAQKGGPRGGKKPFNKDFGKKRPHSLPQEKKEPDRLRYPSQNPYDRLRPKEPALPKGLSWDMLSSSDKDALRSLSREHAENVGLHILAAYELEGEDLPLALEHAKWAASNASRIDIARECLALMAYRSQDFKTALKEFLTVRRLNGESDWIPFIADCYRGLGEPQKAIETIRKESPDASAESKLEMMLVMAGAFADLKDTERALKIIRSMKALPGLPLSYKLRACEAEQTFLFMAGKKKEADAMEKEIEDMESKVFPEEEEEGLVDFDLENLDERVIEDLLS
ncbi:MAG: hypothetical protein IIV98_00435 [Aeriscardovia sp.]|nr:hypothetical protein [Aeriscardovia sp.]